jgi:2,3-bisphosphoglycerate-dependent phosphoglycerate mutase
MGKLILLRHGKSIWNKLNRFTGWVDIPLSSDGIEEALNAGKKIKDIPIDIIFMSSLARAQMTTFLAMLYHSSQKVLLVKHPKEGKMDKWANIYDPEAEAQTIPVYIAWQLNERMYGKIQGVDKGKLAEQYGKEQVHIWRRSFNVAPPGGESLAKTAKRTLPYFKKKILPHIEKGKNVFISAHGNSLRSIIMYLDKLSEDEVVSLELATGEPIIYEYDNNTFHKQM